MWLLYAAGSAFFAGITSILAKIGIKHTDSNVATALRTVVVLIFSWLMVYLTGAHSTLPGLDGKTWIFLALSGLATGGSWLCYFRALQLGPVNKVVPIDKSSTVLAILMAILFLGERENLAVKLVCAVLIGAGTYLMIEKKPQEYKGEDSRWLIYAAGSAIFAALTSILGKVGMEGVDSNLGTGIRTIVVLVMAWVMVAVTKKGGEVRKIPGRDLLFIGLSGLATGGSWLCYYHALQIGEASLVVPIDKLSILITIGFSYLVFGEKLSKKSALGLALIVAGTLLMVYKG